MIVVNEHEVGTCKMTKELEEAFLASCKYNDTTPENIAYFRSYVWNLFAIMKLAIDKTGSKPEEK